MSVGPLAVLLRGAREPDLGLSGQSVKPLRPPQLHPLGTDPALCIRPVGAESPYTPSLMRLRWVFSKVTLGVTLRLWRPPVTVLVTIPCLIMSHSIAFPRNM